jgi:murein DD-endopeptidase MepM/ murein hydrolase activator NlpD
MRSFRTHLGIASFFVLAILILPASTGDIGPDPVLVSRRVPPGGSPSIKTAVLKSRETLEMALRRSGVSRLDALEISAALRREMNLRRLTPGEQLVFERGKDGELLGVVHQRSPIERYEIRPHSAPEPNRGVDGSAGRTWTAKAYRLPVETRVDTVAGHLEDSLFASVERLGEGPVLTTKFVALFEWDFDFAADALPGDEFRMLVEKRFAKGEFVGYGDITAAEYRSADRPTLSAVRFPHRGGSSRYYDFQGRATRKIFLRAPLEFSRITSGYSHARRHPILGGLRPHLAIDYGAPIGTAVRAVADGVVTAAGWAGGYGLSVTVHHARGYETMYNHLSRTRVRHGDRVRQRDVIGHVGATGLATGPHLDYRLRKNGRAVDPLSETFIPGEPVSAARLWEFQAYVQAVRDRLALGPAENRAADPLSR